MTKRAIYQGMRNDLRTNLDLISSHYAVITATAGAPGSGALVHRQPRSKKRGE